MSILSCQLLKQKFIQGQVLFKQLRLSQAKQLFVNVLYSQKQASNVNVNANLNENLFLLPQLYYDTLINLSTIQLQLNNYEKGRQYLLKAFKLNQYRYQAFYNLAILEYYCASNISKSYQYLNLSLSLLYFELGSLTGSLKLMNKSISLNSNNLKAYIQRGLIYQKQSKIKLAQNQFQRLTYQIDQGKYSCQQLTEIYAQKALMYKRIKKTDKMEENLIVYHKYRTQIQQNLNRQSKNQSKLIFSLEELQRNLLSKTKSIQFQSQNIDDLKQKVTELVLEVKDLISQIKQETKKHKKQALSKNKNNLKSNIDQIKTNQQPQNIFLVKQTNLSHESHLKQNQNSQYLPRQQQNLLFNEQIDQQAFSQSQHYQNNSISHPSLSNPSISINQDEDSAILNQKIQQLQRQIKQSGGNVPEIKDLSRHSEQQNFLQYEIQKTIDEINKKKVQEHQKKIKQEKGENTKQNRPSLAAQSRISAINQGASTKRDSAISDDKHDTNTLRSKLSQTYELNLEQIKNYSKFVLQIRSTTMFDQKCPKKDSYAKAKYFEHQFITQKCKNEKFTWNHIFDDFTIKHSQDEVNYEIQLQVHAKEGGWLSWHNDALIGTGIIKLTNKGETKCTLQNKGKKVGTLYYKIKLIKNQ